MECVGLRRQRLRVEIFLSRFFENANAMGGSLSSSMRPAASSQASKSNGAVEANLKLVKARHSQPRYGYVVILATSLPEKQRFFCSEGEPIYSVARRSSISGPKAKTTAT
jgi:hypothetical protein